MRVSAFVALSLVLLGVVAPDVLAQAGGGSSGFSGGSGGGGGGKYGGGGSYRGDGDLRAGLYLVGIGLLVSLMACTQALWRRRHEGKQQRTFARLRDRSRPTRQERDARVSTASAAAAEDDPVFAAPLVTAQAAALYVDVQRAWSMRDDATLERLLGPDLLVEWRHRLADFASKGWVNEVEIRGGPAVELVGLVNRTASAGERVTVTVSARLHSVVRTPDGAVITRDVDADGDGEIEVCEYWTLAPSDAGWRLVSVEQEQEGAHHLAAPIVAAPSADCGRLSGAPPAGTAVVEHVSVAFAGTAREKALDLALVDPRCAPDVLEVAARRALDAWAEAVDGDDGALLAIASPRVAHGLRYPYAMAQPWARVVVRGPQLLRVAITALDTEREPPRMEVTARITGVRYVEHRDTLALLWGSTDHNAEFTEHWTFALDGRPSAPWQLVASRTS